MRKGKLVKLAGMTAALALAFSSLTVSAAGDSVYTTQRGDNLSKIAQKVYGDKARWKEIYEANKSVIADPNKIWANQQFIIPGGTVENVEVPQLPPQSIPTVWPELSEQWQAAKTTQQSYVEQNGLQFYQGTSFTTQGARYDNENPSDFEFVEINGVIRDITIRDAEKEGYQVVTISTSRSGQIASYWDRELTYLTMPGVGVCDIYTGRILPSATTSGDVELVNTADLTWGGITYSIDYIQDIHWNWGEWDEVYEWNEDTVSHKVGTADAIQTFTIPKGYDGLAIMIVPRTEGPSPDQEYNVFDNTTEEYILDNWKEGSYLMRVSDLYNMLHG